MPTTSLLSILAAIARSLAKAEDLHRALYDRISSLEKEIEQLKSRPRN
jgi:hypothetical protein